MRCLLFYHLDLRCVLLFDCTRFRIKWRHTIHFPSSIDSSNGNRCDSFAVCGETVHIRFSFNVAAKSNFIVRNDTVTHTLPVTGIELF